MTAKNFFKKIFSLYLWGNILAIVVVAFAKLFAPVLLLEHLVHEQNLATIAVKLTSKLLYAMVLKIEIVQVDIEALLVAGVEIFLSIR